MDPLTALGFASNVFACISFASNLIKGTIEIGTSPTGCSAGTLRLESIYRELESLCDDLKSCIDHPIPHKIAENADNDSIKTIVVAIKTLSAVCKDDCDELLQVIMKAKTGAKGTWASFRVALKMAWDKKKIDDLEERLSRDQTVLTMHICTLANLSSCAQSNRLEHLLLQSRRLGSDQADDIKSIKDKLDAFDASFQLSKDLLAKSDVDCLQKQFQTLSILEQECAKEQSILQSLTFDTRPVRHEQIAAAHKRTFAWALKKRTEGKNGSSIGEWLEQGNGIYWISGKPGSGKSTLMKFIADSPITSQLLKTWAKSSRLIVASHYFWLSGTEMQKSYQGLFQTLLYDIFRQMPPLIRQTCAGRWTSSQPGKSWSLSELREVVQHVSKNNPALRFCLFIDGMDEYDGDHESQSQLCQGLKDLAKSENVKLCLSSRPWNVFEEAFGHESPKLYVQDLTRDDIRTFIESRLQEHPRWAAVSAERSQGQALVSEITEKSDGVFLWVHIVVKLLREGLTNRDEMFDLRRRLQGFPSELGPFFKTILESVQPFYHSHMATALQLAIASDGDNLLFLVFYFLAQEHSNETYAVDLPMRAFNDATIRKIKSNTTWHLDSRTHGLLEVNPHGDTVHFLHRTARDFLMTKEMLEFLAAKVDQKFKFNPTLSIVKALVATIKLSLHPLEITRTGFGKYETEPDRKIGRSYQVSHLVRIAVKHDAKFEFDGGHDVRLHSLLDELDRSLLFLLSEDGCTSTPRSLSYLKTAFLREQLVQHGLFDYLHNKIKIEPAFLADIGSLPPTRLLPERSELGAPLRREHSTDVITHVLKSQSVDPMKKDCFQDTSPWLRHFSLISCARRKDALDYVNFLLEEGLLMLSLKSGADPNVEVKELDTSINPDEEDNRAATVIRTNFREAIGVNELDTSINPDNRDNRAATVIRTNFREAIGVNELDTFNQSRQQV